MPGLSYDNNGDPLNASFFTYSWDAESNPVNVGVLSFTFDALGRMVEGSGSTHVQIVYSPTGGKLGVMVSQSLVRADVPLPGGATAS